MNLSMPLPTIPEGDTQPSHATAGDTQAHAINFVIGCARYCLPYKKSLHSFLLEGFVQHLVRNSFLKERFQGSRRQFFNP